MLTERVSQPGKQETVYFSGGGLTLAGVIHWPQQERACGSAVVCHPHSLRGGDMDNNVVVAVADELARRGIAALRFNFRGVGYSEGSFGDGVGEQDDVRAALAFVRSLADGAQARLGLVGYSFGCYVGLSAALAENGISAAVGISPPLTLYEFAFLTSWRKPLLLLTGARDPLVPLERFQDLADSLHHPVESRIVQGADHFWLGHESEVARAAGDFLLPLLCPPAAC